MVPATLLAPTKPEWRDDPGWLDLADACERVQAHQSRPGSVNLAEHRAHDVHLAVLDLIDAVHALAPRFADDAEYLDTLEADLRAWIEHGFATPDFHRSLLAFRPDRPGEHLAVAPLSTHPTSGRRAFEAFIMHTDATGEPEVTVATWASGVRAADLLPIAG